LHGLAELVVYQQKIAGAFLPMSAVFDTSGESASFCEVFAPCRVPEPCCLTFGSLLLQYVDPILDRLDPKGCVRYRLYRDATHYTHGKHVRVSHAANSSRRSSVARAYLM
jgi:hypothetical protein